MIVVTNIEWDTDSETAEECRLPTVVLVDGVRDEEVTDFTVESEISDQLSDAFGFCHKGFTWNEINPSYKTHAGGGFFPDRLGFINLNFCQTIVEGKLSQPPVSGV